MAPPQAARAACRYATPLQGATPTAQQSRLRGVPRLHGQLLVLALIAGQAFAADAPATSTALSRVPQPVIEAASGGQCVADPAFMRRNHMDLLRHQRDDTLRGGVRNAKYSLKDCIACHANKTTHSVSAASGNFCQSCHAYAAVKIDCFECHANKPAAAGQPLASQGKP